MPSASITSKSQKYTQSYAVCYLTSPESLIRPDDTPLIDFSDAEKKEVKKNLHQVLQHLLTVVMMFIYLKRIFHLIMMILGRMREIQSIAKICVTFK